MTTDRTTDVTDHSVERARAHARNTHGHDYAMFVATRRGTKSGAASHTRVHHCAPSTHVTFGTSRRVREKERKKKKYNPRVPNGGTSGETRAREGREIDGWPQREKREREGASDASAKRIDPRGKDPRTRRRPRGIATSFSRGANRSVRDARVERFFLGIYRVLTPADGPRARRLSIWLPLHSDV